VHTWVLAPIEDGGVARDPSLQGRAGRFVEEVFETFGEYDEEGNRILVVSEDYLA
jgi:hypothetical protein